MRLGDLRGLDCERVPGQGASLHTGMDVILLKSKIESYVLLISNL